ncbi:MAG: wax ester/triacylglycerol synthase domain-containing protein [Gemmatimonadota bacterium]
MAIERLTAGDELMLWPDETWPQDIGALVVLDGRKLLGPDGRFRTEAVTAAVAARLHLVPRFRQVLYVPPRRLGRPLWVDAPAFDIREHIRVVPVAAPGGEEQLLHAVAEQRRRRLERSRPLWELVFLTGLADGRVGLFVRLHHVIADGMASVAAIGAFLDPVPDAPAGPAPPWLPAPAPAPAGLLADSLRGHARQLGRGLSALAHPVAGGRRLLTAWPAVRELLAAEPVPVTSLNRVVGPGRSLALARSDLAAVKQAAHSCSATVNDVLLAATASGLRALLRSRGEPVDGVVLRMYVPVSLHRGPHAEARGNLIGQIVVPLPIGVSDPRLLLRRIAAETSVRKARAQPPLGRIPHRGPAGRVFLKLVARQRVNVTSANLPGPDVPLYFAGAPVLEVFPLVDLLGTVSLAVGAMSYAGRFGIMVTADQDAYPDLGVFAAGLRDGLRALTAQPGLPAAM